MRSARLAAALLLVSIVVYSRHMTAQSQAGGQADHQHAGEDAHQHAEDATAKPQVQTNTKGGPKPENQPGAVMNAEELAASHADHHEMTAYDNGGRLPQGWRHRFDLPDMKLENLRFASERSGFHVTSGPPGIFYDPLMTGSGSFVVRATFTQLSKGSHMEGYGPFVGGKDLDKDGQQYTYFLLRQDGKYLIKQRVGVNTKGLMDWTANRAIKMFGTDGKMTNELAINVDATAVHFLINGVEVDTKPRSDVDPDGIAGLRVNHNLDLQIDGLTVAAGR